jgi:hypothetical protein
MNGLFMPNGQPVQRQVRLEPEQTLAVSGRMLEAQIAELLTTFRIPPPILAENLIRIVAGLVAPAQPAQARGMLVDHLCEMLRQDVSRRAADIPVEIKAKSHL